MDGTTAATVIPATIVVCSFLHVLLEKRKNERIELYKEQRDEARRKLEEAKAQSPYGLAQLLSDRLNLLTNQSTIQEAETGKDSNKIEEERSQLEYLWQEIKTIQEQMENINHSLEEYKRRFTRDEVLKGTWIKKSEYGDSYVVKFLEDGTLLEFKPSNPKDIWNGKWKLIGDFLRMNVGKYELDIFANKEGNVHSGIERVDGEHYAYFTVTHDPNSP